MTELKPCPFCGCQVELFVSLYGMEGEPFYYAIAHPGDTDCILDGEVTTSYPDKEVLIKDWNRRVWEW